MIELLTGPARYRPRTRWPALAAIAATVAIMAAALAAGAGVLALEAVLSGAPLTDRPTAPAPTDFRLQVMILLAVQITAIVLTVAAAGRFGSQTERVLALNPVSIRMCLEAFLGLLAVVIVYNALVALLLPQDLLADLRTFVPMVRSPAAWQAAIAIALGAPLSEELLFRGFLFSALARTRLGIVGAGAITALAWASLHATYSLIGVIEVLIIGLYLSWVLWRSGSVLATIACHAIYNLLVTLALFLIPLPA